MRKTASVPCGTCTLCCRSEAIILHPEDGDDPSNYETIVVEHPLKPGEPVYMLKPRAPDDTTCRYLGPFGCSIHAKRPVICREFDCRGMAEAMPRIEAKLRKMGRLDQLEAMKPLVERGQQLLKEKP